MNNKDAGSSIGRCWGITICACIMSGPQPEQAQSKEGDRLQSGQLGSQRTPSYRTRGAFPPCMARKRGGGAGPSVWLSQRNKRKKAGNALGAAAGQSLWEKRAPLPQGASVMEGGVSPSPWWQQQGHRLASGRASLFQKMGGLLPHRLKLAPPPFLLQFSFTSGCL